MKTGSNFSSGYLVHAIFSEITAADTDTLFLERLQALLLKKAFDSRYTVRRLSKNLRLSPGRLYRKLKSLTGQSAVRMIQNLRLNKAKHLLLHRSRLPIADVALACGYENPDYFTRLFARRTGLAPSRFRCAVLDTIST